MTERQAWELAGKVTAVILIGAVVVAAVILAFKQSGEQPRLPLVSAKARVWQHTGPAPPQFCASPMPICRGGDCPKSRSVA